MNTFIVFTTFIVGILAISAFADKAISSPTRKLLVKWLERLQSCRLWSFAFGKVFDDIFSKKFLSWKFFNRSCLASCFFQLIMILVNIAISDENTLEILKLPLEEGISFGYAVITGLIILAGFIINTIPDYISLKETRYILRYIEKSNNWRKTLLFFCVDIVLTTLVFLLFLYFILNVHLAIKLCFHFFEIKSFPLSVSNFFAIVSFSLEYYLAIFGVDLIRVIQFQTWNVDLKEWGVILMSDHGYVTESIFLSGHPLSFSAPFFYSTFFTSIWIWMFILSAIMKSVLQKTSCFFYTHLLHLFHYKENPVLTIGFISVPFLFIIFILLHL